MKSLNLNLKRIRDALNTTSATGRVYHYTRPSDITTSWIVWQEDGESSSLAVNNHKTEQQIHGTIDCYSLEEYDGLFDEVQDALNIVPNLGWSLLSVDYEDETNLIHYQWEFNIA